MNEVNEEKTVINWKISSFFFLGKGMGRYDRIWGIVTKNQCVGAPGVLQITPNRLKFSSVFTHTKKTKVFGIKVAKTDKGTHTAFVNLSLAKIKEIKKRGRAFRVVFEPHGELTNYKSLLMGFPNVKKEYKKELYDTLISLQNKAEYVEPTGYYKFE